MQIVVHPREAYLTARHWGLVGAHNGYALDTLARRRMRDIDPGDICRRRGARPAAEQFHSESNRPLITSPLIILSDRLARPRSRRGRGTLSDDAPVSTLDVFTETALAGNPLAVVLDAEGLDDARMQAIAARVQPV